MTKVFIHPLKLSDDLCRTPWSSSYDWEGLPKTGEINSGFWAFWLVKSSGFWATINSHLSGHWWSGWLSTWKKCAARRVFLCMIYQYFNYMLTMKGKKTGNIKGTKGSKKGGNIWGVLMNLYLYYFCMRGHWLKLDSLMFCILVLDGIITLLRLSYM